MKDNQIKIFIIDDHASVREGYRRYLEFEGFKIVGETNILTDNQTIIKTKPDIVLMDIELGSNKQEGIELAKKILKAEKQIKILFISHHSEIEIISESFKNGASGYFTKSDELKSLIEAIKTVNSAHYYISPTALKSVIDYIKEAQVKNNIEIKKTFNLTETEKNVLSLIADGLSNKEIARIIGGNEKKVKNIVSSIITKLEAKNRANAVKIAIKNGVI